MKKLLFLLLFTFYGLLAQQVITPTGYSIKFGTDRNSGGIPYTFIYSNTIDTAASLTETDSSLLIEGIVNEIGDHIGIIFFLPQTIDLSNPAHKLFKLRFKDSGTSEASSLFFTITDTNNIDAACIYCPNPINYITEIPTTFTDYNLNLTNRFNADFSNSSQGYFVCDSTRISSFRLHFTFPIGAANVSDFKFELEEIQIGDQVAWEYNTLTGKLFNDLNNDCIFNGNDTPIGNGVVKANPGNYYGLSDENGNYEIMVDTGHSEYIVTRHRSSLHQQLLAGSCPENDSLFVQNTGMEMRFDSLNFGENLIPCFKPYVEVNSNRRRRCFRGITTVSYGNVGTQAQDAEVRVVYPAYLTPISSIPQWTQKNGDTLVYSVQNLLFNYRNSIQIVDSVACWDEGIRGLTQCIEAYISPQNSCLVPDPNWDLSNVVVKVKCENGIGKFTIENTGLGDMSDSLSYRLYLYDTLILESKFKLNSNELFSVNVDAAGHFFSLYAEQSPHNPWVGTLTAYLEGCINGTNDLIPATAKGIAATLPQFDRSEEYAISCMAITDSYDPNDKQVSPLGKTEDHLIKAGTRLNYQIRFENTGSDTAYKVVVVDTLDLGLDVDGFEISNASHSVQTSMAGSGKTVVTFTFGQINLPPKSTDSVKCHGFISFYIPVKENLTDGSEIRNTAYIYFDYNSAIITNTVSQKIGEPQEVIDLGKSEVYSVGQVIVSTNEAQRTSLQIYPNPGQGMLTMDIPYLSELELYSAQGQLLLKRELSSGKNLLDMSSYKDGMYCYRIIDKQSRKTIEGKYLKQ